MHIVREEHWAATRSHAYMVKVSAGKNKSSISYEIILLPNALSIKFEESNICFLCCPGMDVQAETFPIEKSCVSCLLELCTGGIEVPLCDTWLKNMYVVIIHGNPS